MASMRPHFGGVSTDSSTKFFSDQMVSILQGKINSVVDGLGLDNVGGTEMSRPGDFKNRMMEYTRDTGRKISYTVVYITERIRTMNDFIIGSGGLLPVEATPDKLEFVEETVQADPALFQRIPQGGVGPLVTVSRRQHIQRMQRYGLSFQVDSLVVRTPTGELETKMLLDEIANGLGDTLERIALEALLGCPSYVRNTTMAMTQGAPPGYAKTFDDACYEIISQYGVLSSNNMEGLSLIYKAKEHLVNYRKVVGDNKIVAVMPGGTSVPIAYRPANYFYSQGGRDSSKLRDDPRGAMAFDRHAGVEFVFTREYAPGYDVMERLSSVGEYVLMCGSKPVMVYDEQRDSFVEITPAQAIKNCCRWDDAGNVDIGRHASAYSNDAVQRAGYSSEAWKHDPFMTSQTNVIGTIGQIGPQHFPASMRRRMKTAFNGLPGGSDDIKAGGIDLPLEAAASPVDVFDRIRVTRDNLVRLVENGIEIPFNFMLIRRNITHRMATALVAPMGGVLGRMMINMPDVCYGEDPRRKQIIYNATAFFGAVLRHRDAVVVYPNFAYKGYVGGNDTTFCTGKEDEFDPEDVGPNGKSMRCYAISVTENEGNIPTRIHVMGQLSRSWRTKLRGGSGHANPELDFGSAPFYTAYFGDRYTVDEQQTFDPYSEHSTEGGTGNNILWRGAYYSWNEDKKAVADYHLNTGHTGPTYTGCARVRRGNIPTHDDTWIEKATQCR